MKNKVLVLVMVFSLLVCSGKVIAKERRGADLVITKTDGQQITGELIAVKPSSLLLLDSQTGTDVSADINDIRDIRIVKKSRLLLGAGGGLLVGAIFGALVGAIGYQEPDGGDPMFTSRSGSAGFGAFLFAVPGALAGAVVGILHGKDETIHLEGKSPEEIKAVMEKLRSQARITDFQ